MKRNFLLGGNDPEREANVREDRGEEHKGFSFIGYSNFFKSFYLLISRSVKMKIHVCSIFCCYPDLGHVDT